MVIVTSRLTVHDFLHRNHAPAFGIKSQPHDRDGNGYFIVAGECCRCDATAAMSLKIHTATSIKLTGRPKTAAGKARCTGL